MMGSEQKPESTRSITGAIFTALIAIPLVLISACERKMSKPDLAPKPQMLTDQQIASLTSKKIFFGHHSVGNNILQGVRDLAATDQRLKLNIVKSPDPQSIPGPALVEFEVGRNGDPQSKIDTFAAILDKGMGAEGGIAMFKFCYVDINSSTDIPRMFASYRDRVAAMRAKYPAWKPVHITVPLTAAQASAKDLVKSVLGRATARDLAVKRNQFNTLMRQTYGGVDPIFDLAEVESTHGDGSRSYFMRGNEKIYTLAPEFTDDGGHLNEAGRRVAAERLLSVIAQL